MAEVKTKSGEKKGKLDTQGDGEKEIKENEMRETSREAVGIPPSRLSHALRPTRPSGSFICHVRYVVTSFTPVSSVKSVGVRRQKKWYFWVVPTTKWPTYLC